MESIILDLTPSCVKPVLHASQYDDGRQWKCNIEDNGTPYAFKEGDTAELNLRKGDGTVVTSSVAVVPGQTYAVLVSTEQMCAVWGSNLGELTIRSNGVKVGSCNFILEVEKDPTSQDKKSRSEIWDLHAQVESEVDEVMSTKGASDLAFDNTDTDLDSTNTEDAIKEVNTKANTKADSDSVYDKTYMDGIFDQIDNAFTGVNTELGKKADKANTYTKAEVNTALDGKANASDVYAKSETYSKSEVDTLIDNLPEPMIFKGTLGVGGTIQTLPTASASNEGFTYKVITDGTYAGQTAKSGDVFTSNGSAWVLIPSGDEDNDTWRAIKVNGTEKLGNAISSGSVDFVDTDNVKFNFEANGNKVKATLSGVDTSEQVNEKVVGIIDDTQASSSKVWSSEKIDTALSGKADKTVNINKFIRLTKSYSPACISPSGYVNQGSLTNGFSVSNAYPIGDLTKIIIPYDFSPRDEEYLVIGFYTGAGLGSLLSGVAGTQRAGLVVSVPSGANYFRITCPDTEPFGVEKTITTSLANKYQVDCITDRLYGKGSYLIKGDMTNGTKFEIPQTNCQNNQVYSFTAKADDFSNLNLIIGHGKTAYDSCYITITATNCDFTRYSSSASVTTNTHGLTLSKFIDVKIIVKKHGTAKVVIQTENDGNGVYEYSLDITTWTGCSGDTANEVTTFAELAGGSLTDCVFSWSCSDFRKQLWAFGDSYFAYYGSNFMQILDNDGFYDNILVNGFSGENSAKALVALKNMLQYFGKPKYILWCLGQNDGSDTTESNYTSWLSAVTEVLNLCSYYDITPILCTIPSVPKGGGRSHESKNTWIRSSGYRFVDMAKAVGAEWNNGSVTWYFDMLKTDNEHPSVEGGKAIEKRMIMECPEITFKP